MCVVICVCVCGVRVCLCKEQRVLDTWHLTFCVWHWNLAPVAAIKIAGPKLLPVLVLLLDGLRANCTLFCCMPPFQMAAMCGWVWHKNTSTNKSTLSQPSHKTHWQLTKQRQHPRGLQPPQPPNWAGSRQQAACSRQSTTQWLSNSWNRSNARSVCWGNCLWLWQFALLCAACCMQLLLLARQWPSSCINMNRMSQQITSNTRGTGCRISAIIA